MIKTVGGSEETSAPTRNFILVQAIEAGPGVLASVAQGEDSDRTRDINDHALGMA